MNISAQRTIEFPNNFYIYNISSFELDDINNVYLAGDGQYPDATGYSSPASFVIKTNKNLVDAWRRIDSTQTSYSRVHIDRWGRVLVVVDYYANFPQVYIKRFTSNGQSLSTFSVPTDAGRYSVTTLLDNDDNILMYGGKTVGGSSQAMYLKRISRVSGSVVYSKTHFEAPSSQVNDFKLDRDGDIFTLVTQNTGLENQKCKISRIKLANGSIIWNRNMNYTDDSCNLTRLVINDNDRIYAIGERRSCTYFPRVLQCG